MRPMWQDEAPGRMTATVTPNAGTGRLRVAFVASGYPTAGRANAGVVIHRSIRELSACVQPYVIHLRAWVPGRPFVVRREWEGVPVLSVACPQSPSGMAFHLNAVIQARLGWAFVRGFVEGADVVHSTNLYSAGYVASQWAVAAHKPHTTHVTGSDWNLFLGPRLARIGTRWLRSVDGVACHGMAIMNQLTAVVPDLPNVVVVYRGVDSTAFSPEGPTHGPLSSLPPVRFLYLGGFHSWDPRRAEYNLKGGHTLLKAWQQVEARIAPSSLLIAGPGTELSTLQAWRASLRRPEAVFLSGAVSPSDVPALIRACDVVVIPSLHEGVPNVANEAQSCGRPVLGTDAGGIPESVVHGQTGWIVPRGDPEALASGLEWFHAHRTEVEGMGANGRARMIRHFTWERFSEQMAALFGAAIQTHRSRAGARTD